MTEEIKLTKEMEEELSNQKGEDPKEEVKEEEK